MTSSRVPRNLGALTLFVIASAAPAAAHTIKVTVEGNFKDGVTKITIVGGDKFKNTPVEF